MQPIRPLPSAARLGLIAAAALLATGCSVLQEDKIDYRSAQKANNLDIPPDLTQLSRDSRYQLPGAVVTASGYQSASPLAASGEVTATSRIGDVRIERSGALRWLVVDRPADKLWSPIKDFWQENGFTLAIEQQPLGVMETDWNENRAKLPQDFIRRTIGRVFDSLYSTSERDKFRTRLERNPAGGTDIFISHRGTEEVYTSTSKEQTVWQPRASNPELENEFLRRLMLKLGATQAQAQAALTSAPARAAPQVITIDNAPALQLDDGFDRAWRRIGLSLDRSGFTVEDRNRSQGIYFVRLVSEQKTEPASFFSRLLGSNNPPPNTPVTYRIEVRATGENSSSVRVLNAQGEVDKLLDGERILQLLASDMQ